MSCRWHTQQCISRILVNLLILTIIMMNLFVRIFSFSRFDILFIKNDVIHFFESHMSQKKKEKRWSKKKTNILYLSLLPCCRHQGTSTSLHVDTKESGIVFFLFKALKLSLHHALSYNNKLSEWLTSSFLLLLFFFDPIHTTFQTA
jgi:hypothetical protein